MLLGYLDAAMSEKHGHTFQWHAGKQQLNREGVTKAMGMSIRHAGELEQSPQSALPIAYTTLGLRFACPKVIGALGRNRFKCSDHEGRQRTPDGDAGLGRVEKQF